MLSRVRRTARQTKSPPPMELTNRTWTELPKRSIPTTKASSPINRPTTFEPEPMYYAGLGDGYTVGEYKDGQRSLLQTVIHNLVDSSEDDVERDSQRNRLQNDLEIADERLEELVREHRGKLHGTVSTFQEVDERIKDSQAKIHSVKSSLSSCKSLLRCKRDELKRLWLEDVKYKNMLQMINKIEEVRAVPEQLKKFKQDKYYLHATELLNNSVARLEHDLSGIEALKELRQELLQQKECFHEELIDELHRHLYVKASAKKPQPLHTLDQLQNEAKASSNPAKKRGTLTRVGRSGSNRQTPMQESSSNIVSASSLIRDDDQVLEEMTPGVDPEEDSSHYMAILVESLSILGRIQDALDAVHMRMEKEFLLIIERASVQVTRMAEQEEVGLLGTRHGRNIHRENQPKLLAKMLKICFKKFQDVVSAHAVLLVHLHRAKRVYCKKASFKMYEEPDVWGAIQHVLQNVLEVYLVFDEEFPVDGMSGLLFSGAGDAYAAFSKKKHTSHSKKPYFRFESSRHAISVSTYMREQRDIELVEGGKRTESSGLTTYADDQPSISQHLVCKPHNRNITVLFGPVRKFVLVVEESLGLQVGDHCRLYHFLHDFVDKNFLDRVRIESFGKMTICVKPEAAKTIAPDQKAIKITVSNQYVLNSVLVLWQLVEDFRQLMKDLPMYAAAFLSILCELLIGYRDSLMIFSKDLTSVTLELGKGGTGCEPTISSRWARDEDINRMIRSLPNWLKLRQGSKVSRNTEDLGKMQEVYAKESATLTQNLGGTILRQNHVMLDHENLRLLAIFHESLDWFNSQLKHVVMELTNQSAAAPSINLTDGATISKVEGMAYSLPDEQSLGQNMDLMEQISQFSRIQFEFQALSETAIITLHLEVRCHCFYFLSSVQKSSYVFPSDCIEEDPSVRKLAADLKDIDQVMVAVLSSEKYRYLFEGLGHLVSSIFIASSQHMKSINTNGIKKLCRNISVLQTCLSKITLIREKDLDRARRFYEMLYLNHEEIIRQLIEQGTKFTQKEYTNALTLLATSSQTKYPEEKLREELQQIDTIFSKDAV